MALAGVLALVLGAANLGVPSLWHDELVHVEVARAFAEQGRFVLPSGVFYPSSMAYNAVLGGFIAFWGDNAAAVRFPSVLFSALNVVLVYRLARRLLGRETALVAAFALALSPWSVAWAREARLYTFQVTMYLFFLSALWRMFEAENRRPAIVSGMGAFSAYVAGMLASFHSILFLAGPGVYAGVRWIGIRRLYGKWVGVVVVFSGIGLLTLAALALNPNEADRAAVFSTGIGGTLVDLQRADRYAYFRWLNLNLSTGVFLTVLAGSALACRQGWRGVFVLCAFWAPVLVLTYLIGYRRARFMFFAYPVYCMLFAHGIMGLLEGAMILRRPRGRSRIGGLLAGGLALGCILFLGRLGVSLVRLTGDTLDAASGDSTTLARRHPQWKKPCAYVREHLGENAVLTTTFLPVYYYVGRVDDWFPNRYNAWEVQESGLAGLDSLEALRAFLAAHPKGYFLAEHFRFEMWRDHRDLRDVLGKEVAWVQAHMKRLPEASSADVNVYEWDFTGKAIPPAR